MGQKLCKSTKFLVIGDFEGLHFFKGSQSFLQETTEMDVSGFEAEVEVKQLQDLELAALELRLGKGIVKVI